MNGLRRKSGVTITVLVLAIIILIILAGITMSAIIGNNGILDTATETKVKAEVSSYTEELDVLEVQTKTDQINVGLTASEYIDEFKDRVGVSTVFEGSIVNKMTSVILRIQTPEGYVFYVTEDGIEYAGINGEFDEVYEILEEDFTFTYSPTSWTNEDVTVIIELNFDTDSTIQYSLDGEEWIDYEEGGITIETNCMIYARLVYEYAYSDNYITGQVTNIDKLEPVVENLTSTTNSITITASDSSDGTDGVSGIVGYYISTSSSTPSEDDFIDCRDENGDGVTSLEVTVDGLKQNTTYYVWVIDDAGNINSLSDDSYIITESVPNLTEYNVEFTQSEDDWTNEDVMVYVDITDEDIQDKIDDGTYILEYSIDGGETWEEYDPETGITVEENTAIEVRLSDGDNTGGSTTHEVDNIDKTAPEVEFAVSSTAASYSNYSTAGTITISLTSVTDEASGIATTYYYSIDGGETYYSSTETEYTFTETSTEDDYEVAVYVEDNAGNIGTATESYTPITGDWVDYPIDINEDGDTTNDWRLFYIDDDGIMFIIAADYMENTNELLDLEAIGMYSWSNSSEYYSAYALTWEEVPETQTVSEDTLSLFMSTNSTINNQIINGTYDNDKCVTTLLNTDNWANFVDSDYAQSAIGGPTLEMWIASWNVKYTTLYCGYSSSYPFGYSIGLSSSSLYYQQYITSSYVTDSGYNDTLYYPYQMTEFRQAWLVWGLLVFFSGWFKRL